MAETSPKTLKAILEAARERIDCALKQLQDAEDDRGLRWKCMECGYIKHFSRPAQHCGHYVNYGCKTQFAWWSS